MTEAQADSEMAAARAVGFRVAQRRGLLGHPLSGAGDLASAAILRLCEAAPQFDRARGAWPSFAQRVLYQGASDHLRLVFGHLGPESPTKVLGDGYSDLTYETVERGHGGTDPSAEIAARLDAERLASRLTEAERDLVRAFYLDGTPQRLIAERLGTTEAAVKRRVARALQKLRRLAGVSTTPT